MPKTFPARKARFVGNAGLHSQRYLQEMKDCVPEMGENVMSCCSALRQSATLAIMKEMRITPADLTPDSLTLDLVFAPGTVHFAPDVQQVGPLHVTGSADRLEEHRGPHEVVDDIRLRARVDGDFELLCARCLDPIRHHANQSFDLIFRPAGADAELGERSISEAETEIGYYDEGGLLLEDAVREQVLLSLPDRSLCREDCKGLCPHCGANHNESSCSCTEKSIDSRWGALQGFASAVKS